jgi:hypothetical protein
MNPLDLPLQPVLGTLFSVTWAAFGVVLAHYVIRSMLTFRWTRGEGIVCRGQVEAVIVRGSTGYRADVAVDYVIRGKRYRCERIHFTGDAICFWPGFAERSTRRYVVGSRVPLLYNPRRPWEAVLRPGLAWFEGTLILAFTLMMCGVGGWGLIRCVGFWLHY